MKLRPIRHSLLAAAMTLIFGAVPAAGAAAADTYTAGGVTAIANPTLTEATIESISYGFDQCGTDPREATCTWSARIELHADPASKCVPSTPAVQVVWESEPRHENGAFSDGARSFPLEGCPGQSLVYVLELEKTYEPGAPIVWSRGESIAPLFTFGRHPIEEMEEKIRNASPPAIVPGPPLPPSPAFAVSADCRWVTIADRRLVFAFKRIGCRKAGMLGRMRILSGQNPNGYRCRALPEATLCRRIGHRDKFVEWRVPGSKPASR
jgi:hypothetical protein